MLILNTRIFQKKILPNLISVPIYSFTKSVLEDDFKYSYAMKILQTL